MIKVKYFLLGVLVTGLLSFYLLAYQQFIFYQGQTKVNIGVLQMMQVGQMPTVEGQKLSVYYLFEIMKILVDKPYLFCDSETVELVKIGKELKIDSKVLPDCE
jgi:hypothetical protein